MISAFDPQLGLGGDVTGPYFKGFILESQIVSPSQMIMFGDAKADGSYDGSLDPTEQDQWPSNRHGRRTNLEFVDGHIESRYRFIANDELGFGGQSTRDADTLLLATAEFAGVARGEILRQSDGAK